MNKKILKSRKEYSTHALSLDEEGICGFCEIKQELIIAKYKHWILMYSEFPYWKYNTILISRRHVDKFSDLFSEEVSELTNITNEIDFMYKESGIIGENSPFGVQLLMFWRSRFVDPFKNYVAHFHLHICPEFEKSWDDILDDNAQNIDIDLLKKVFREKHENK